jgi:hypothetical protein
MDVQYCHLESWSRQFSVSFFLFLFFSFLYILFSFNIQSVGDFPSFIRKGTLSASVAYHQILYAASRPRCRGDEGCEEAEGEGEAGREHCVRVLYQGYLAHGIGVLDSAWSDKRSHPFPRRVWHANSALRDRLYSIPNLTGWSTCDIPIKGCACQSRDCCPLVALYVQLSPTHAVVSMQPSSTCRFILAIGFT